MLFNSYIFILAFLPIVLAGYHGLLHRHRVATAQGFLVAASLTYYAWWNPVYLPLIIGSMTANYFFGRYIRRNRLSAPRRAGTLLILGITANLALLGFYKYADFFIRNANALLHTDFSFLRLLLPLAISFFTFQQIAYLADSRRSETPDYDFLRYAVFVSFFPQLIAGPIVHHREMMPQFADPANHKIDLHNIATGIFIFAIGLFKKVVVADTFALWANKGFDEARILSFLEAWKTSLSYTFQLYYDFSGYTDMAIGAALLFNIHLPINFNSPYRARNIQDFWQRWHITLSRFLREYIYIPLGGNRRGSLRTCGNLILVFLIGGLWHGAGWTFVFWGFLHGLAMVIHRLWKQTSIKLPGLLSWFITFNFVNAAWVFFRAPAWTDALKVLKGMTGLSALSALPAGIQNLPAATESMTAMNLSLSGLLDPYIAPAWIVICLFIVLKTRNSIELKNGFQPAWHTAALTALLLSGGVMGLMRVSEFLYFNF